jgi:hypothetical protein
MLLRYLFQRSFAVWCFIDIFESQLRQKPSYDTSDCPAVIHYQNAAEVMDSHFSPQGLTIQSVWHVHSAVSGSYKRCDVIIKG